jgi:FkbM family methyltransferase
VDVGCFHPFYASNTARLYGKGWRGLNVDMDERKIRLFRIFRRRDKSVAAAVSDQPDQLVQISRPRHGSYGSRDKLEPAQNSEKALKTKTLTQLIDDAQLDRIDFLSIDVEGHDFAVLSGLDFKRFKPQLICVEIHVKDSKEITEGRIMNFLKTYGYELAAWYPPSVFFKLGKT